MAKKEKKGLIKEFKEFAIKGNMIDLAVGMIIGAAFNALVSSLVNDIIMPVLGLLTGKIDFSQLFVSLDGNKYATLADAEAAGAAVVKYGAFVGGLINFIIMAFVVFLIVKGINTVRAKAEEKAKKDKADEEKKEPTTKICPFCQSEISIKATKCPHCTSDLK
ncbi:MAG: large conductance mechanosensitive channel protein MscL [Lachnospiraceae bacterium]|nr:large conductance mechanosensitive channel protein MscL [Lachnospiraceae bacterium]